MKKAVIVWRLHLKLNFFIAIALTSDDKAAPATAKRFDAIAHGFEVLHVASMLPTCIQCLHHHHQ
jgi:hypothetical protein